MLQARRVAKCNPFWILSQHLLITPYTQFPHYHFLAFSMCISSSDLTRANRRWFHSSEGDLPIHPKANKLHCWEHQEAQQPEIKTQENYLSHIQQIMAHKESMTVLHHPSLHRPRQVGGNHTIKGSHLLLLGDGVQPGWELTTLDGPFLLGIGKEKGKRWGWERKR